ncbi:MAG: hypothetical protein M1814_006641 [Vezdaea aestivalis]|nr:MAG: hypothetical protein M1814_006641 [Vezdaea aestivalis]
MYRPVLTRTFATAARQRSQAVPSTTAHAAKSKLEEGNLQKAAKRDPELYVLLSVMTGAFCLAGWYFGRKPTSATSESNVAVAPGSMPWEVEGAENQAHFKYQYHPGGDPSKAAKNAPSALHSRVIPNVTLTRKEHERVNKWGKEDW